MHREQFFLAPNPLLISVLFQTPAFIQINPLVIFSVILNIPDPVHVKKSEANKFEERQITFYEQ
jgi:hypothetical protein